MAAAAAPRVCVEEASKRFGALVAVDRASVTIEPGSIAAIVGENGAGKSTLLKLAAGVLTPDEGRVTIGGEPLASAARPSLAEAIRRGVGMVHQHFMLVGAFRAIDNIVLGAEITRGMDLLDERAAIAKVDALAARVGLAVPLLAVTDTLTVGERQRLEILRVLFRGARAILLDEPTAVLSPMEAEELYATLRLLADGGAAIAVVTHRLDEVTRFADHVTVMRRGKVTLAAARSSSEPYREEELTRAIMGGDPPPAFTPPAIAEGAAVTLAIRGLSHVNEDGRKLLDAIDLDVRAGEIVGIAGVEGNGQRELVLALAGLLPATGSITIGGEDVTRRGVAERRAKIAIVHEDRHREGLVLDAPVGDNLVLGDVGDAARTGAALDERATIARRIERFDVRPADPSPPARALSGGNQQKIVIARALDRLAKTAGAALVLAQPTRGVDVGAAAVIHRAIGDAAEAGLAVVVVSADLAELQRLSHRIAVMRKGAIVADLPANAGEIAIGRAMLGIDAEGEEAA